MQGWSCGDLRPLTNPENLKIRILEMSAFQKIWVLDISSFWKPWYYMLEAWHFVILKILIWDVQTYFEKGLVTSNTQIPHHPHPKDPGPARPGAAAPGRAGIWVFGVIKPFSKCLWKCQIPHFKISKCQEFRFPASQIRVSRIPKCQDSGFSKCRNIQIPGFLNDKSGCLEYQNVKNSGFQNDKMSRIQVPTKNVIYRGMQDTTWWNW